MLSPQFTHIDGYPEQVKPDSIERQLAAQPSVPAVFPSSQTSDPRMPPSPQTGPHDDVSPKEGVVQPKYCSIMQVLEQPSPLLRLKSSHCSVPNLLPSPQGFVHTERAPISPEQVQSISTVHVGLQPSFAAVFPSSHASEPYFKPSPHAVEQEDCSPGPRFVHA